MNKKYWAVTGALGCITLILLVAVIAIPLVIVPLEIRYALRADSSGSRPGILDLIAQPIPEQSPEPGAGLTGLTALYEQVNPGVVNIQVVVQREMLSGRGAGSGGGVWRRNWGVGAVASRTRRHCAASVTAPAPHPVRAGALGARGARRGRHSGPRVRRRPGEGACRHR